MNFALKAKISSRNMRQYEVAEKMGVSEAFLSKVITNRAKLTKDQERHLAHILNVHPADLFIANTLDDQTQRRIQYIKECCAEILSELLDEGFHYPNRMVELLVEILDIEPNDDIQTKVTQLINS